LRKERDAPADLGGASDSKGEQQMSQWEQETPDTTAPDTTTPDEGGGQEGGGMEGGEEGGGESGGEPTDAPA
jgi:hypothetical protein